MVAFRSLCVLLIGVVTVSAKYSCPDLFNDKSQTFSVKENVCIYMMDVKNATFLDNFHNATFLSDMYKELLNQFQGDTIVSGRGYWSVDGYMCDVYYIAFEAEMSWTLNETHSEIFNADMEEYLLKQCMLTSFINCIPLNLTTHQFICYGGKTDENGEYIREVKTAYCRGFDGIYVPIEHGLDVCAYHVEFADDRNKMTVAPPSSLKGIFKTDSTKAGYVMTHRSIRDVCKLYRDGLDKSKLEGIDDSGCLKNVNSNSYDILCCFYGKQVNFEEEIPKHLPANKTKIQEADVTAGMKSFCAVVEKKMYYFDYSWKTVTGKDMWEVRAFPSRVLLTWSEFIETHFKKVCMSSVKYKFDGLSTQVTQTVFGLDSNRTYCYPKSKLNYTQSSGLKKVVCPFETIPEINELDADYCCQGYLCNHRKHDLFAQKKGDVNITQKQHCRRQLVFDNSFPQLPSTCYRLWDPVAGKEFLFVDVLNFASSSYGSRLISSEERRLRGFKFEAHQFESVSLMDLDAFEKMCPVNPPGFLERRRAGIPWTFTLYLCSPEKPNHDNDYQHYCDGDENFMEKFDDSATLLSRCYDHPEGSEVVPFSERRLRVNKESVFCFMKIHEDENYDLKFTAGSYNGSTSLSLYNDFNIICSLKSGNGDACNYDGTIRTAVCCFNGRGNQNDGVNWSGSISSYVENATIHVREWKTGSAQFSCRDSYGFLKSCYSSKTAAGCYMKRQMNMAGFEESGCLWMGDGIESTAHALCEHDLLNNSEGKVAYCRHDEENESIFCCCRRDEDCQQLRNSYGSVLFN